MKRASISVTAQQVADMVGVSESTVGRALADDARISAETRMRVKNAAERCGYLGNVPARIMRGGASNLVGLILPDVRNDFYASMAQALTEACGTQGHQIVLSITGDDAAAEARSVRELASGRVAGVIVVLSPQPRRETIDILRRMPCVQLLRRVPELDGGWFGIDDEASLFDATTHLLRLGHERVADLTADRRAEHRGPAPVARHQAVHGDRRRLRTHHPGHRRRDREGRHTRSSGSFRRRFRGSGMVRLVARRADHHPATHARSRAQLRPMVHEAARQRRR